MKIYFTGAHSCGKSTLCRYVSEKYNVPMITETARMILSERELQVDSLRSNIAIVNDYQTTVFNRQIEEEKKHSSFVSDRCLIDAIAYACSHSVIGASLVWDKRFNIYLEGLKDNKTLVFFVRPSKATLKQDGVREQLSWDGVVSIDAQIKLLLEMFGIRYFGIDTPNMQERIRNIDNIISLIS